MTSGFLLDTHVLNRWLTQRNRLSALQRETLREAEELERVVAVSGISLTEIAFLAIDYWDRASNVTSQIFDLIEAHPLIQVLPITVDIARDVMALKGKLQDPQDCIIVATARVHGLKLMTLDQRIIESRLVPVID